MRVVFMGTPDFALSALRNLHEAFEVVGVFTQPDREVGRGRKIQAPPVKVLAQELGLKVFQPQKMTEPGAFQSLRDLKPQCIVVAAYGQILKQEVLDLAPLGCVNIHSSLLPRWRGAAPINWAIWEGDAQTGVTTMQMVLKLDAGDILQQETLEVGAEETAGELHDRLAEMGGQMIVPTLKALEAGSLTPQKQDEAQVTYASKLDKGMQWLDPSLPVQDLHRRIRALHPWPGSRLDLGEYGAVKLHRVQLHKDLKVKAGTLQEVAGMLVLGGKEPLGGLEIHSLQWEGKKVNSTPEFLNGLKGRGISLPLKVVAHEQ